MEILSPPEIPLSLDLSQANDKDKMWYDVVFNHSQMAATGFDNN